VLVRGGPEPSSVRTLSARIFVESYSKGKEEDKGTFVSTSNKYDLRRDNVFPRHGETNLVNPIIIVLNIYNTQIRCHIHSPGQPSTAPSSCHGASQLAMS
jgi:hypothetical protein